MSEPHPQADAPENDPLNIVKISALKADIDVIFIQLRHGGYASMDTFANNWAHLIRRVQDIKPLLSRPGVTETLLRTDVRLTADLMAISYAVEIIENFMACAAQQAKDGKDRQG
ncbi:hypothetical protein MXM51_06065 [Pantoea stewartii]|uniref:hypothetical protein n=1 Tax=Pantoea stewartii TaxID=66269 RepID=UPI002DBC9CD4|nr:hypothetical protein [Pantoea stewartii]MEB6534112.1 hypothetical protein [Pantoea stewartii]